MVFHSWKNDGGATHEINLTPLIDVSLVLVVMLLLATPLAFESSINVKKDDAARAAKQKEKQEQIEIVVLNDEEVRVNANVVQRADLTTVLEPLIEKSADHTVMIGCDHGVMHGTFVDVLDQAKMSGAKGIAVFER